MVLRVGTGSCHPGMSTRATHKYCQWAGLAWWEVGQCKRRFHLQARIRSRGGHWQAMGRSLTLRRRTSSNSDGESLASGTVISNTDLGA
mmetsp:Transcript_25958/g.49726  ORF Transcript_25958/g.49726 Transcript_25958/m.49726 type:complete len:89 (-) Transcript_25958:361-627(-)